MKFALFGNGSMGQLVSSQARAKGHELGLTVTSRDSMRSATALADLVRGHDVAIDFSVAGAVITNVTACAIAGVPLVEGTTGWKSDEEEVRRLVADNNGALIYGANFSVGVNLFFRLIARTAELFQGRDYAPFIAEAHHSRKRDAPSGTALRLQELLVPLSVDVGVASTRAGFIPGTHTVGFDSEADQITLQHVARNRDGFASGALLAADWIVKRKGVYEFSEMFDEL